VIFELVDQRATTIRLFVKDDRLKVQILQKGGNECR
jgi:hypothetical protein